MTAHLTVAEGVATLHLDRPPVNALDTVLQDRLGALAAECASRDDVRAVILWGGEKVFAAGADVKEMHAMTHADMAVRVR
ncbi:enoyl-CoA hydratase-related protein, partial [Streptomyces sp. NPDC006356]